MSFIIRDAVREKVSLLIGIAGASGSGKTFSALELATGLVGPEGRIGVIDTEAGRALHYADRFRFRHLDLTAPFSPARYQEAIAAMEDDGCGVIVIDSMSHEWEGVGGLVEWAAELEARGVKSPGNWRDPKQAHKRLVARLLQCRAHLIFCFRADEKIRLEQVEDGGRKRTVIVPLGWVPITEKRFLYELTVSMLMSPENPGVPVPVKIQDQHRHAFPDGARVSRHSGKALADWAHGGAPPDKAAVQAAARRAAADGTEAFRAHWRGLSEAARADLQDIIGDLRATAEKADRPAELPGEEPDLDLQQAEAAGMAARVRGMSRRSVPAGFSEAQKEAWLRGWEYAEQEDASA